MTQAPRCPTRPKLSLLGGFGLVLDDVPVTLGIQEQRVLAYLALVRPPPLAHRRADLAERLWPVPAVRSAASLRTALWRLRQADERLVRASRDTVRLHEAVDADVWRCAAQAGRLLSGDQELRPQDTSLAVLRGDLLPGWDEEWLLLERERLGQVRIHALEALAGRLCGLGRYLEAIEAAYAAIGEDPLRESAHAALIEVFLAEGNVAQARRQLERYTALLWAEMALRPSAGLTRRVRGCAEVARAAG
ncbi:SARP family transcriptional regulator [Nonomuraea sp. PA05]|uniref:AfsR/SARP family transcriptional regulator n=1 Tax=Nonomuraea sp. PA05 TaxID=2604466 RepID=UPI0011D4F8CB|nr:BTAD domain-containing putative transcriptional regulator [Nonomuraea sp. PA05]TYB51328.1 SARP family transcriptional regulator [Nonomuraea sp. PA05]